MSRSIRGPRRDTTPLLELLNRLVCDSPTPAPAELMVVEGDSRSSVTTSLSLAEWRALAGLRPNVMIIGSSALTTAVVTELIALTPSVFEWTPHVPLPKPGQRASTLVMHDVCTLSLARQDRWIDWLDRTAAPRPQILTTSHLDVWPLVTRGMFRSALYYRLNTVLLKMRRIPSPTNPSASGESSFARRADL